MSGTSVVPNAIEFKDRRLGCIVFGAVEIAMGCLCALMIPLLFFALAEAPPDAGLDYRTTGLGVAVYACLAVALVWLGIGSILCRRWARVLLVVASWSWLLVGVLAMGAAAFAMQLSTRESANPLAALILIVTEVFLAVFFVALPGAMALFYQSKHVKATCEARDPVVRWTDTCPLQVLATSLWLGIGALATLAVPVIYRSVVPLFGVLLSGAPATLMLLAFSAISLYLAWGTYRLKLSAWWTTVVATVLFGVSTAITFWKIDVLEIYRQMGYPEQQIAQMRSLGFHSSRSFALWIAVFSLLFLGYLLWVKKYFSQGGSTRQQSPA